MSTTVSDMIRLALVQATASLLEGNVHLKAANRIIHCTELKVVNYITLPVKSTHYLSGEIYLELTLLG